jgi:outer membrane protein OmpA-like peptidoglycan-associated protein
MKSLLAFSIGMMLLIGGTAGAGDMGFEDTAEGMAKALLKPSRIKTRGLGGLLDAKGIKVRGLTLVEKQSGQTDTVEKSVTVPKGRTGGFVNLAVRFDVNSYAIRSDSIALLDELGKALNRPELSSRSMFLNGHTDSDGGEAYNLKLSLNRALAVRQYLASNHDLSPGRLKIMGYGEGVPLVANTSAANKQSNRRVEVVMVVD